MGIFSTTTVESSSPLSQQQIVAPPSGLSVSDGWNIAKQATATRKSGNPEEATKLARDGLAGLPDFEPLRSALSWALYDKDVKSLSDEPSVEELRQGWNTCREIKQLLASELYGEFSAWTISVLRVASGMLSFGKGDNTRMIASARDMLVEMDNSQLSREGFRDTPSPAERHALGLTKAYHQLKEWKPLRSACEQFISELRPRGETELWLRHRLGLACLELGDAEAGTPHLQFVLQRKPNEWWALYNLGRAQEASGDQQAAIKAFAEALKGGNLKMKTGAMLKLATLLRAQGRVEDADRLHIVARSIRLEQGWSSTAEIDAPLESDQASTPQDLSKLKELWNELTPEIRNEGKIITVFENGGAGFIELDDGDRVYFSMKRDQLAPPKGTAVTCKVVDSFDKKKNEASRKAIDVREVNG